MLEEPPFAPCYAATRRCWHGIHLDACERGSSDPCSDFKVLPGLPLATFHIECLLLVRSAGNFVSSSAVLVVAAWHTGQQRTSAHIDVLDEQGKSKCSGIERYVSTLRFVSTTPPLFCYRPNACHPCFGCIVCIFGVCSSYTPSCKPPHKRHSSSNGSNAGLAYYVPIPGLAPCSALVSYSMYMFSLTLHYLSVSAKLRG